MKQKEKYKEYIEHIMIYLI